MQSGQFSRSMTILEREGGLLFSVSYEKFSLKTIKSNAKTSTNPLIILAVRPLNALLTLSALNLTAKRNAFASMDMNLMIVELAYVAMIGAKVGFRLGYFREMYSPN